MYKYKYPHKLIVTWALLWAALAMAAMTAVSPISWVDRVLTPNWLTLPKRKNVNGDLIESVCLSIRVFFCYIISIKKSPLSAG